MLKTIKKNFIMRFILILSLFVVFSESNVKIDNDEIELDPEWISPSAWGIQQAKEKENSPKTALTCPKIDKDLESAGIKYRRLVNYLFKRSRLIKNDFDNNYLVRIHLQISDEQLNRLESGSSGIGDIDEIIREVIESSHTGVVEEIKEIFMSWWDMIHYYYLRVLNSQELLMIWLIILFFVSTIILNQLLGVSRFLAVILNIFVVSFCFEYMACNRKLEIENLIRAQKYTDNHPCVPVQFEWLKWSTWRWPNSNTEQDCTEYYLSLTGHNRQMCLPSEVFTTITNGMIFKFFENFLDVLARFAEKSIFSGIRGFFSLIAVFILLAYLFTPFIKQYFRFLFHVIKPQIHGESKNVKPSELEQMKQEMQKIRDSHSNTAPVVNVQVILDKKALGDYVEAVPDEEPQKIKGPSKEDSTPECSPKKKTSIETISNSPAGDG